MHFKNAFLNGFFIANSLKSAAGPRVCRSQLLVCVPFQYRIQKHQALEFLEPEMDFLDEPIAATLYMFASVRSAVE